MMPTHGFKHTWAPANDGVGGINRDTMMVVWHTYSTACQPTWLSVQNLKAVGGTGCEMWNCARFR